MLNGEMIPSIVTKGTRESDRLIRQRLVLFFGLSFLLLALGIFSGCSKKNAAASSAQGAARPAVPVAVATVLLKTVPVSLQAIGIGEAFSTVAVKSMVSGEITRVNFVEGQDVKKGQLLFSIDSRSYEAALKQAEANLARDVAQEANAKEQAARYQNLFKQGIVSQQTADQFQTTSDALEAAIRADKAAIENVKVQLSYCAIYSPTDGRTGSLLIHRGNVVKANDTPSLVVINQINPINVNFSVPEQNLPEIKQRIKAGRLKVAVTIPQDPGGPELGELTFVDNTVDATTGTIKLKATFPNQQRRLWPGQFVNVTLTLSSMPNAVVIPSQAVQVSQNGQFVFVVKSDRTVESRPVVVDRSLDGEAVIARGLQPGETVVTDGQLRLVPGSKVQIKNEGVGAEVKGS